MLVSICVATFKRPKRLRMLLEGLNKLVFEKIEQPEIEIIVVDNDCAGVASKICDELESQFQWSLKTGFEPEQGLTYARNKTIEMVSANADFIAILDDDEIPESLWLERLILAQSKYGSEIVTGPVIPRFMDQKVPNWIVRGKFFEPARFHTGKTRPVAYTNNVLIKADLLRNLNPAFDNRFAFLGGSDCFLFLNLYKAGYKITWADDAIVYDNIPSSRTNLKWILFRAYRQPSSYSSAEKELYPSFATQLARMLKGFALIGIGLIRLIPSVFFGRAAIVNSLIYICRGLGTLGGLIGVFYEEYKNIGNLQSVRE